MTNMTYVQAIDYVLGMVDNDEVKEKLEALKVSLEKRNSHKSNSPTKAQKENAVIKTNILEMLADGEPRQCKTVAETMGISIQKCSALLKQLVDDGQATKSMEKKIAYFKAVA